MRAVYLSRSVSYGSRTWVQDVQNKADNAAKELTPDIACRTASLLIRPLRDKLLISSSFEAPELRQAIVVISTLNGELRRSEQRNVLDVNVKVDGAADDEIRTTT